MNAKNSTP